MTSPSSGSRTVSEGRSLQIQDLYSHVGRCSAPGCGLVFGSTETRESLLFYSVRRHWRSQHSEQPECEDKDKVEITHLIENGEVNSTFIISADQIKSCKPCKVILYNI